MIVEEYIEMNVFESESKKWIAVIKGTEAMLYFSLLQGVGTKLLKLKVKRNF